MDCNITHVCFSVRGILSHAPHTDGGGDDDAKRDGMALTHKGEWDRVQKVESVL